MVEATQGRQLLTRFVKGGKATCHCTESGASRKQKEDRKCSCRPFANWGSGINVYGRIGHYDKDHQSGEGATGNG